MINIAIQCIIILFFSLNTFSESKEVNAAIEKAKEYYFNKKYNKALALFMHLTDSSAEAQFYCGLIYQSSNWKKKDYSKALSWFERSGDNGYLDAYWQIGVLYDNGMGVEKDPLKAMDWYRKSKFNKTQLSSDLILYSNDETGALKKITLPQLYEKLKNDALDGNANAQYQLAQAFDYGYTGVADLSEAVKWYLHAAENNHSEAQFILGYFYCRGIGFQKNCEQAEFWFNASGRNIKCK